jgi:hypothetical protein
MNRELRQLAGHWKAHVKTGKTLDCADTKCCPATTGNASHRDRGRHGARQLARRAASEPYGKLLSCRRPGSNLDSGALSLGA